MVKVNGEFDVEWEEGMTVRRLLEKMKFTFPMLVVSINGQIVLRDDWDTTLVPDGADVKVLHMVAGG